MAKERKWENVWTLRDRKLAWYERGPVAKRDFLILLRDRKLREMATRDITFMEQRRYLDIEYLKSRENE